MPINLHFPLFLGGGSHLILWEKKPKSYHQGQTKEGRWMNWKWAPTNGVVTSIRGVEPYLHLVGAHLEDKGYNLLAAFLWTIGHFFHEFPKNTLHESQIKLKFSKKNPNQPRIAKSKSPTPNSFLISEKMKSQDFTSKIFWHRISRCDTSPRRVFPLKSYCTGTHKRRGSSYQSSIIFQVFFVLFNPQQTWCFWLPGNLPSSKLT